MVGSFPQIAGEVVKEERTAMRRTVENYPSEQMVVNELDAKL